MPDCNLQKQTKYYSILHGHDFVSDVSNWSIQQDVFHANHAQQNTESDKCKAEYDTFSIYNLNQYFRYCFITS